MSDNKAPHPALLAVLGGALIFAVGAALSQNHSSTPTPQASTVPAATAPVSPPSPPSPPPPPTWSYVSIPDDVAGTVKHVACIDSDAEVHLNSPYHDATMRYCIRYQGSKLEAAWIAINGEGQMVCDFEDCRYLVRYDDGTPRTERFADAADNDSAIKFFTNFHAAALATAAHKIMRAQVRFFQNGDQNVTFHIGGFISSPDKWPK